MTQDSATAGATTTATPVDGGGGDTATTASSGPAGNDVRRDDAPAPYVAAAPDVTVPLPLDDGFDRVATRLYLLAVRTPGITRRQMITADVPADAIDAATAFLTHHGLLRPTGPDAWEAIPPELALFSLAASYETRASFLRDAAEDLTHEYHRSRLTDAEQAPGLTLLRNTEELAAAERGVTDAATQEIWSAHDDSPRTAHLFGTDPDRHRRRLLTRDGAPLRRRTTFDGRMLRHPRAGEILRARAESGEESRFLTDLPFSVVGADDHIAVVDLTSFDTSGAGSLLVHDRRLVLALRCLCETWWQLASPMAWNSIGELDRDSAFILSMLAAGATDATMATQTGLSQRTIERRVRALMTRLGASTRFQAGVLAARRGWI
ncbi:helix-turn-helix transcriptional regulator [Mobilicoccus pelagius]|uniref:Putative LuxR family transcriptional regulator n=1 Tax=Mobilicoccus pelagius NBRC 104925 TaxID=1089455 RepID=H5UUH2_9MICO|nr:helix-turn-helix transcriptional regulator [Mobilicoccus pelagius]GAB49380.1 putative LuxR family transcriptional regulator [Mobilicoccus pelagius NBRC 104925]